MVRDTTTDCSVTSMPRKDDYNPVTTVTSFAFVVYLSATCDGTRKWRGVTANDLEWFHGTSTDWENALKSMQALHDRVRKQPSRAGAGRACAFFSPGINEWQRGGRRGERPYVSLECPWTYVAEPACAPPGGVVGRTGSQAVPDTALLMMLQIILL